VTGSRSGGLPAGRAAAAPKWRRLWIGLALLALGACGSTTPEPTPPPLCPATLLLEGAERTTTYRAGAEARPSEIRYLAVLRDLTSACRYYSGGEGAGVDVDLTFNLIAERGPALSGSEELTYFVATMAPDGRILAKETLKSELAFAANEDRTGWSEDLTLRLPTVTPNDGGGYTLYVGFQLDEAELVRRRQSLLRQAP
jgi:hypothetical protein